MRLSNVVGQSTSWVTVVGRVWPTEMLIFSRTGAMFTLRRDSTARVRCSPVMLIVVEPLVPAAAPPLVPAVPPVLPEAAPPEDVPPEVPPLAPPEVPPDVPGATVVPPDEPPDVPPDEPPLVWATAARLRETVPVQTNRLSEDDVPFGGNP
jgi:hypothetical protein